MVIAPRDSEIPDQRGGVENHDDRPYNGYPIDMVYTWVNGSDPEFLKSVEHHAKMMMATQFGDATSAARFFDWDTMRYSLRSVQKFAPWVRNLFVITNGQVPVWLNVSHPRVRVINHEEIFPNRSHLPTFNSNAIEHAMSASLHKI